MHSELSAQLPRSARLAHQSAGVACILSHFVWSRYILLYLVFFQGIMRMAVLTAFTATTVLALLVGRSLGITHEHLTFDPPFRDVDHYGKRMVGIDWDMSGAAKALKNFVRLTPDLQVLYSTVVVLCTWINAAHISPAVPREYLGVALQAFGNCSAGWIYVPAMHERHLNAYRTVGS